MRLFAAFGALIAMSGAALGADYLRGSKYDEPSYSPVAAFTWEGFYGGAYASYNNAIFDASRQSLQLETQALQGTIVQPNMAGLFRLGRTSEGKFSGGAFLGYNWQFEDVVYGLEGEFNIARLYAEETRANGGTFLNLVPDTIVTTPAMEPAGTFTNAVTSGTTRNRVRDYAVFKARAGYAMGRFLPYLSVGVGVARTQNNADVTLDYATFQRINNFNTVTVIDPITGVPTITRTTFINQTTPLVPAASGTRTVVTNRTAYKPGVTVGVGVDWMPFDNFFLRAEYQAFLIGSFNGVDYQVHSARLGGGLKF